MKKILLFAAVVFAACSCDFSEILGHIVQGDGVQTEVTYELPDFNAIKSVGSLDVIYSQTAGAQSIILTCDQNLAEYYDIDVEDGTLCVSVKQGYIIRPKARSFLTISSDTIKSVSLSGSGDCDITGNLNVASDFKFTLTGSGSLEATGVIECKDFESKITGSGDIDINGLVAKTAKFSSLGSGDVDVKSITADTITMSFSGSGSGNLYCKDAGDIDVRITGSGSVRLSGNARSLNSKVTGSGKVNDKGLELPDGD
jgi:hypothetical protein